MAKYVTEAGSYVCQVVEPPNGSWFTESKEKGTPGIVIRAVINDENSNQHGAEVVWTGWLSEGAFDRTIKDLADVFGFDGDLKALESGEQTFVGLECQIVVEAEEWEGKTRFRAKWLNAVGRSLGAPAMEKSKVNSLIAKLGSRAKAIAKTAATKPQSGRPF